LREIESSAVDLIYQRLWPFSPGLESKPAFAPVAFVSGIQRFGSLDWKTLGHVGMIPLLERFERLNLEAATRIFVVADVERRNLCVPEFQMKKSWSIRTALIRKSFDPASAGSRFVRVWECRMTRHSAALSETFGPWTAC